MNDFVKEESPKRLDWNVDEVLSKYLHQSRMRRGVDSLHKQREWHRAYMSEDNVRIKGWDE